MSTDTVFSGRSSYPGGKSGSGIYQRLINLIPPHRVLLVPFAGRCGVTRNIRPAEHTILIDKDPIVCEWWSKWCRSKNGRALEIHNCDGIEWMRFNFGCTRYHASPGRVAGSCDDRSSGTGSRIMRLVMGDDRDRMQIGSGLVASAAAYRGSRQSLRSAAPAGADGFVGARVTPERATEYFILGDPPYVMSERAGGKLYNCELTDDDHLRLLGTVTTLDAAKYSVMLCGFRSGLYSPLDSWESIDHRVPTRRGLQDERIWMNYPRPTILHDYQYIGDGRRSRERIRRRQKNWEEQLMKMEPMERAAMLEVLSQAEKNNPPLRS